MFEGIADLPRHINSPSFDLSIEELGRAYGLEVIKFPGSDARNGWIVPKKYRVREATIKFEGKLIYDGAAHPLGVISHSAPFSGVVPKRELLEHLHFDVRNPDWIPYHFRQTYRPWIRDWGFCMPRTTVQGLPDGDFEVLIDIEEGEPELLIARGVIEGKSDLTFALCAHLDHPGMANDGLSGVMVACEAFSRLQGRQLEYGLEVLIVPEIIGSEHYLGSKINPTPFEGLFIESVGRKGSLVLQSSLTKSYIVEDTLAKLITAEDSSSKTIGYKEIFGNDEGCFEAYGCPMPALHRGNFVGYHSSADDFTSLNREAVDQAIEMVMKLVEELQSEVLIRKNFSGVVALSNPLFDVYVDPGQPGFGTKPISSSLRRVMEIMSLPQEVVSLREICLRADSNQASTYRYLKTWEKCGLINMFGSEPIE